MSGLEAVAPTGKVHIDTLDREILVAARWEAETVYMIADLIRRGVLPSQRNLDRLALSCNRLTNVIREMGGDQQEAS